MRHKKAQSLLASLALGELKPNEQRVVEQHVEGCSACQQELEELLQTFVLLKEAVDTLPARSLTPERTASVLHDELDKTVPKIAPRKLSGFWPMFRSVPPRRWVEVAAVAAIFVIVGALVFPILGHTVSGGGGNTYCISSGDEWEAADAAAYEGTDDLASNYQPSKPALLEPTAAESIDRLRNIPDKEKRASYRKRRRPGNIAGGDADVSGYMGANFPKESSKRPASPREPKRWGGSEKQKEEKLRALFSDEESKLAPSSRPKLRLKGLGRDILSPKGPAQKRALDFDGDGLTNVQEWKPTTEAPRPAPKRAPRPAKPKPVVPADPRGSVRGLPDLKGNGGGGMGGGRELADREATVSGSAKAPAPKSKPARQKSVFFTIGDSGKVDPNALATAPATPKLRLKGLGRDIIAPRNSRKPQVVGWRDRALKDDDGAEDITEIDSTSLRKSEVLKKQQDLSGWTVEAWVSPVKKPEGEIISRTTTPTDTPINESGNAAANYELGATEVVDTGGALARVEPPPPDEVTDTDGDGLSDREEISKLGTNPLVADTDNDGVDDGDEDFAVVAGEKRNKVVAERMEEVHWKWSEPIRPQLPKSDVKLTVEPQPEELNENEILRRGEQELVADELTVQALKLSRQKDYQGAADKYREAQSRLRLVSGNRPRIKAKQAKIEEALARRESILAKGQARDITEDISSVTPVEKGKKDKVHALNLWQKQGDVFMRAGRYGDARDKYEKILYEDPYNTDAIRGLKKLNGELRRAVEETRRSTVSERMAEVRWNGVPAKLPPVNSATVEDELRAGNLDRAKSMLKQIILDTPDGPEAAKAREGLRKLYAREFAQAAAEAADDPLPPAPRVPPPPVNPFVLTEKDNQSTFALEADTASYTLARRYIRQGYLPPVGVVRMEEFVNAFDYNYPRQADRTFSVHSEATPAPFGRDLVLLKIGIKGRILGRDGRKPAHLVFVIDTSGSMGRKDRLPLIQYALTLLLDQLGDKDRISIIAYGTHARLLLEAGPATDRKHVQMVLNAIECGASTNILSGIELGYQIAARHFAPGQVNRVILCSDGVANVGPANAEVLLKRVENYRDQGISFTSVGVGAGSYDDRLLEQLANKGDGNYIFIDSRSEAKRVFAENMSATIQMIAKDVKIQVEFNPKRVRRYRLIGYENRAVADKDFRNDAIDAGEIGSGQAATALYELELHRGSQDDLGTVYVRYKDIDHGGVHEFPSRLRSGSILNRSPERDPRFFLAACVAEFAEILRGSEHARHGSLQELEQTMIRVANALPLDERVQELLLLTQKAQGLPRAK